jgi:mRNA interferase RelE/StbE
VTATRHRLEFSPAAARQLRKLDRADAGRIRSATEQLRSQPRPPGATALQGRRGYLRVRVGDYRIIYTVDDDRLIVLIVALGHRREVYHTW